MKHSRPLGIYALGLCALRVVHSLPSWHTPWGQAWSPEKSGSRWDGKAGGPVSDSTSVDIGSSDTTSDGAGKSSSSRGDGAGPQLALAVDFPDPCIVQDLDGTWYAFATNGNSHHVQAARAPAPRGPWTLLGDVDALPDAGPWATGRDTWAPDVRVVGPGHYVLYYAGQWAADPGRHCVGAATASTVLGPYAPAAAPLYCHAAEGGAIDPSGYYDVESGTRWIVYKVDGNSIGNGGDCNNGIPPLRSTPILLQPLSPADGTTSSGAAQPILDRADEEGPLVEAPSLVRAADGTYVLFYSSHCFDSPAYDVRYATAPSVAGPYTRGGVLLRTGEGGLTAPGGATSAEGGGVLAFHGNCAQGRCMYTAGYSVVGAEVTID